MTKPSLSGDSVVGEEFGEDYFEHGVEKKLSLYENYRWMPEDTALLSPPIPPLEP